MRLPVRALRFLILYTLFGLVLLGVPDPLIPRIQRKAPSAESIVMVLPSGQKLASFFEGLPKNSLYSLESMAAKNREMQRCRQVTSTDEVGFWKRFIALPTVHAQCGSPLSCSGSYWIDYFDSCNTGGPCSGGYWNATIDYIEGNQCTGAANDGGHCGSICQCGLQVSTCVNC